MKCNLCSEAEGTEAKYKCPTCRIPYCSVQCWKKHKANNCSLASKEQNKIWPESTIPYCYTTEDTVPLEKLQILENNQNLKNILSNRHLRSLLVAIDKSTNPAAAMQQAMLEPIFVEFADECLKVVEPSDEVN